MRYKDVKEGEFYAAIVSGKKTIVRLDRIEESRTESRGFIRRFKCVNLTTGRKCTFKSAVKLTPVVANAPF